MKTPEAPGHPTLHGRTLSDPGASPSHSTFSRAATPDRDCPSPVAELITHDPSPITNPVILHSALRNLHSSNPYCTAVFCSVPRNQIFPSSLFPIAAVSAESTFRTRCELISAPGHFSSSPFSSLPPVKLPSLRRSHSARMLTFSSQVPAIINSNLFFHSSTRTPACFLPFGVHPLGCLLLHNQFADQQPESRPHFAQRTSFGGQHSRGGTGSPNESTFPSHHDSRSERLLWGNQLVAGLGSPLTDLTFLTFTFREPTTLKRDNFSLTFPPFFQTPLIITIGARITGIRNDGWERELLRKGGDRRYAFLRGIAPTWWAKV
jgi:hypothetical protein